MIRLFLCQSLVISFVVMVTCNLWGGNMAVAKASSAILETKDSPKLQKTIKLLYRSQKIQKYLENLVQKAHSRNLLESRESIKVLIDLGDPEILFELLTDYALSGKTVLMMKMNPQLIKEKLLPGLARTAIHFALDNGTLMRENRRGAPSKGLHHLLEIYAKKLEIKFKAPALTQTHNYQKKTIRKWLLDSIQTSIKKNKPDTEKTAWLNYCQALIKVKGTQKKNK